MRYQERAVTVELIPCMSNNEEKRHYFQRFKSRASSLRPYIVLDCSMLKRLDSSEIYLLLCCLEETLKRNGDVRLAKLSTEARQMLEAVGAARLFRIYASDAEAISSFHQRPADIEVDALPQVDANQVAENAA